MAGRRRLLWFQTHFCHESSSKRQIDDREWASNLYRDYPIKFRTDVQSELLELILRLELRFPNSGSEPVCRRGFKLLKFQNRNSKNHQPISLSFPPLVSDLGKTRGNSTRVGYGLILTSATKSTPRMSTPSKRKGSFGHRKAR